jgi:hypothetical protein
MVIPAILDASRWRKRAEDMRALAQDVQDPDTKARCFESPRTTTISRNEPPSARVETQLWGLLAMVDVQYVPMTSGREAPVVHFVYDLERGAGTCDTYHLDRPYGSRPIRLLAIDETQCKTARLVEVGNQLRREISLC